MLSNAARSQTRKLPRNFKKKSKTECDLDQSNKKKKVWSSDTLLKAMEPSEEELEYRKTNFKDDDILKECSKLFKCSKCSANLWRIIKKSGKVPTHPSLGVLMCQQCCDYYENGEFSVDSDGEDKYCRWCGEGGTIFSCSKCICGFCAACIKRHLGIGYYTEALNDFNWVCFFCDNKPLWKLRCICSKAKQLLETNNLNSSVSENAAETDDSSFSSQSFLLNARPTSLSETHTKIPRKRMYSLCSNESNDDEMKLRKNRKLRSKELCNTSCNIANDKKPEYFSELKNLLVLSKREISFGLNWNSRMLKELANPINEITPETILTKCKKTKWFLSTLSARLSQFNKSVDLIEKNLCNKGDQSQHVSVSEKNKAPYDYIRQFIDFINNQVKVFVENDISFNDILKAEIFLDDNVVGIKRNLVKPSKGCTKGENNHPKEPTENILSQLDKIQTEETRSMKNNSEKCKTNPKIVCKNIQELMNTGSTDETVSDVNDSEDQEFFQASLEDTNFPKTDPKQDIQEILSLLENA